MGANVPGCGLAWQATQHKTLKSPLMVCSRCYYGSIRPIMGLIVPQIEKY